MVPKELENENELMPLVDNLVDDEAEKEFLLSKPTCFIIIGKPGVGKSTLAKMISMAWNCVLIDAADLINQHISRNTEHGIKLLQVLHEGESLSEELVTTLILDKLNSAEVEHYGYVLCCLPSMSEDYLKIPEQIQLLKNLKMKTDFIINIKCPDYDLCQRISEQRQDAETGQIYQKYEWDPVKEVKIKKSEEEEEEEEEEEIEEPEEELEDKPEIQKDKLVKRPEDSPENTEKAVAQYKDTMLRLLESVISRLEFMGLKRAAVPKRLMQSEEEEESDEIDTDELLRTLTGTNTVAPGYRWRRSRWNTSCPVALKEGTIKSGKQEFAVGFIDKVYMLSSHEAMMKFIENPRPYLLPPMPYPPCHVAVMGPKTSGKTTLSQLLAQRFDAKLLDVETLMLPVIAEERAKALEIVRTDALRNAIVTVKNKLIEEQSKAEGEAKGEGEQSTGASSDQKASDEVSTIAEESTVSAEGTSELQESSSVASSDATKTEQDTEVNEEHPEVQAIVQQAIRDAMLVPLNLSPDLYTDVLEKAINEAVSERHSDPPLGGWVLDNFPNTKEQWISMQERGILPDSVFFLTNTEDDGKYLLTRLYELNKSEIDAAILEKLQEDRRKKLIEKKEIEQMKLAAAASEASESLQSDELKQPEENQPTQPLQTVEEEPEEVTLPETWEKGFPECPEMDKYRQQIKMFMQEWQILESYVIGAQTVRLSYMEIAGKSTDALLNKAIDEMEKFFRYSAWEMSDADINEEEEDAEALAAEEEVEGGEEENEEEEQEEEPGILKSRELGESKHFCPVTLKEKNVLFPCTDEIAAKYREKVYYFSSPEARESFLQKPEAYVSDKGTLKAPAPRILLLGVHGSGKTSQGRWLADKLGIFHLQFREKMQEQLLPKMQKRIVPADEEEFEEEPLSLEQITAQAIESIDAPQKEATDENQETTEVQLNDEEEAIKSFLLEGDTLPPEILYFVVPRWWNKEPFKSTGFVLEGFPLSTEDTQYLVESGLFPDTVLIMSVDFSDILKRLLPPLMNKWRLKRNQKMARTRITKEIKQKRREEAIAKRRAELIAEHAEKKAAQKAEKAEKDNEEEPKDEEDDWEGEEEEEEIDDMNEIEEALQDEFPPEEEEEEEDELEADAADRIETNMTERFEKEISNIESIQEILSEYHISYASINAGRMPHVVRYQLLTRLKSFVEHREALFEKCKPVGYNLARKLIQHLFKFPSAFGSWDPVKLREGDVIQPVLGPKNPSYPVIYRQFVYFLSSKQNREKFMMNPLKYIRQPRPKPSVPIKIAIVGPPKSGKSTVARMFERELGLERLSIGDCVRLVLSTQSHTELANQINTQLLKGGTVPEELAVHCLEVAFMNLVCNTRGYVLDGYPMTKKQADLLEDRCIIPVQIIELNINTKEVLKRGLMEKLNTESPFPKHDSPQILTIRNSCYKREIDIIKRYYQEQFQNWVTIDGEKSKWWVWEKALEEARTSVIYIQTYLERIRQGKSACIDRLCITPKELKSRLGEFLYYCPVSLALDKELVDCSVSPSLECAAEFRGHYYKMASKEYLQRFLETPEKFVPPLAPYPLPPMDMLPKRLTTAAVKAMFPRQAEMMGFCPVTFLDGNLRYEALVAGSIEYAVEYRGKIFIFENGEKLDKFMRRPEIYWNLKLPHKLPPKKEPVLLTSLPMLGYLEQGVATAIIKALTAVGCLKPKYPFMSMKKSALLYTSYHLKAFNPKNSTYVRKKYKKKMEQFEDGCQLISYLGSIMTSKYKEPKERPNDFDNKLEIFLALKGTQPALSLVI
ncbi:adenylate kinase 9 isoform X2 [Polypterus senegalus]|uniref:adenylate kinase 9 isoform X2 n=1 Tax=Polypterus senegalus TaxID=55291 RepID=UPI0019639927|nr:adenylate kinase 9 isoform X2 [Polypterus senegalus]